MKKILIALLTILSLATSVNAGWYNDMNNAINDGHLNAPIHAIVGIGGSALTYALLPDDMDPLPKALISFAVPVIFSLGTEACDKNFDWGDVGEVGGFAGASVIIYSIDW